jgi:hypothetical protein
MGVAFIITIYHPLNASKSLKNSRTLKRDAERSPPGGADLDIPTGLGNQIKNQLHAQGIRFLPVEISRQTNSRQ